MSERDLRNTIAAAIHDGPSAALELAETGMAPHSWEDCPHKPTYLGDADSLISEPRLHVALSSPPADDVREAQPGAIPALSRSLVGGERLTPDEAMQHAYAIAVTRAPGQMTWGEALHHFATWLREHDARLTAEVRPHGTVTDTEVDRAAYVFWDAVLRISPREAMRVAREAARETRS